MEFAQAAKTAKIQPITGVEVTLKDGSHLTLLAETRQGYSNLCNLITYSYLIDRQKPELDPKSFENHAEGIILLTGCRQGNLASLVTERRSEDAESLLRQYLDWFGTANVFVELQQNLVQGDIQRNRMLTQLAGKVGVGVVATNNVHYHVPERHRLQDALVSIKHNRSLEETHKERRANSSRPSTRSGMYFRSKAGFLRSLEM